jgi:hypothetical protein
MVHCLLVFVALRLRLSFVSVGISRLCALPAPLFSAPPVPPLLHPPTATMLVLFETPAGYALFKLLDKAKLAKPEDVFKHFDTPEHASQVCVHTDRQQHTAMHRARGGSRAGHGVQRCAVHSGWRGSLCGVPALLSLRACASLPPSAAELRRGRAQRPCTRRQTDTRSARKQSTMANDGQRGADPGVRGGACFPPSLLLVGLRPR